MIRVRIAEALGSTPREAGAAMYVSAEGITGSIGGGAVEYMALDAALAMLTSGETARSMTIPLGPAIGQCCGGRMRLELETVAAPDPVPPRPAVLIFGAGHVGRALARALLPLPVAPLLVDQRPAELALAADLPQKLTPLPEAEIRAAAPGSAVVIMTHDHALDFLIAAEALARPDLAWTGMIGSRTKRATFASFARSRGLDPGPLVCPIAAAAPRDKRPEVIAAFAAAEIMAALLTRATTPA
ncbi:xanthine dehydrogenase accessory protein XdhC [Paracoccus sp. S-4012]|uniref:xanthine dehydrogenase accessory protein XdhC n=1 Tax=Paracoccus sp. S-4012 TaxID=2665648 RepID=UPI0012AF2C72|nr:xanthine dehydrogenase accessory protein XdhC [Paracoccus sp. S-4012]MRX49435.1 xanthine dehydrogenase accessory protein XdhC [Paracoccus sp. S-4012]